MPDEKKPFLLRVPESLLEELRRWADAEMRSLNGQIEWILSQAVRQRRKAADGDDEPRGQAARKPRR